MPVVQPGGGGAGGDDGDKSAVSVKNEGQEWIIKVKEGEILRIVYEK